MLRLVLGCMQTATARSPALIVEEMHCEFQSEKQMARVQAPDNVFVHSGAYIRLSVIYIYNTTQNIFSTFSFVFLYHINVKTTHHVPKLVAPLQISYVKSLIPDTFLQNLKQCLRQSF